jgi:hypothetical protein
MVIAVAIVAFGQQSENRQPDNRRGYSPEVAQLLGQYIQAQQAAIETIKRQVGKLEAAVEELDGRRKSLGPRQNLSGEERAKWREEIMKIRGERTEAVLEFVEVVEQQILKLTPPERLGSEHEKAIAELQTIHVLAVEEEAEKTTKHIEELIAKRKQEFEDTLEKHGIPPFLLRPRR